MKFFAPISWGRWTKKGFSQIWLCSYRSERKVDSKKKKSHYIYFKFLLPRGEISSKKLLSQWGFFFFFGGGGKFLLLGNKKKLEIFFPFSVNVTKKWLFFLFFFGWKNHKTFVTRKLGWKKKKKIRNTFSLIKISSFVVVSYIEAKAWQESPTVRTQKQSITHSIAHTS